MEEIWKTIDGYEGYYEVSNLGNVRSMYREIFWNNTTRRQKGRMCNFNKDSKGYIRVGLNKEGKRKYISVHRLVAMSFLNKDETRNEVNHIDGKKSNNTLGNLEWVTRSENMKHAVENKLVTHLLKESERNKKTIYQFDKKGNLLNEFESLANASEITGISKAYISQLCTGARKVQRYHIFIFSHYKNKFAEPVEED